MASEHLIVPLQPEDYGAQGIAEVQDSVSRVVAGPNPSLRLLGYLITMVQARRSIHQLYEDRLRTAYAAEALPPYVLPVTPALSGSGETSRAAITLSDSGSSSPDA